MKLPGTHNGSLKREVQLPVFRSHRAGGVGQGGEGRGGCGYKVPTSVSECAKWFFFFKANRAAATRMSRWICFPTEGQTNLFTCFHVPVAIKHSPPCSQGFLHPNILGFEVAFFFFTVFNRAVCEAAGNRPAWNGSSSPWRPADQGSFMNRPLSMEETGIGQGNWKRLMSAVRAAMAAGSCSICVRRAGSIFSRRLLIRLASLSRISLACLFSGVSLALFKRMASLSLCSLRALCSSLSCILCMRLASRSLSLLSSLSSSVSHARLFFFAVRSLSRRCRRASIGSFFLRRAHFLMGDWPSTNCW